MRDPAQNLSIIPLLTLTLDIMPHDTKPHPDPGSVEPHPERPRNVAGGVDYMPHPEKSKPLTESRAEIKQHITNLYCGSASEADMAVYAEQAVYDDPFSFCDTRSVNSAASIDSIYSSEGRGLRFL